MNVSIRRIGAASALGLVAASSVMHFQVGAFAHAVLVAGGALLFFRKSATAQILARGAAWSVIVPTLVIAVLSMQHGFVPPLRVFFPSMAAAFALAVSHPLLAHDEAQRTFAPLAMRRWFLASATFAIASGVALGELGVDMAILHAMRAALAFGLLASLLVASGIGLVRMRAWGVVIGALSSIVALLTMASLRYVAWPLAATMTPGLMMAGGIVAARLRVRASQNESTAVRTRVSDACAAERVEHVEPEWPDEVTEASRSKMISASAASLDRA